MVTISLRKGGQGHQTPSLTPSSPPTSPPTPLQHKHNQFQLQHRKNAFFAYIQLERDNPSVTNGPTDRRTDKASYSVENGYPVTPVTRPVRVRVTDGQSDRLTHRWTKMQKLLVWRPRLRRQKPFLIYHSFTSKC